MAGGLRRVAIVGGGLAGLCCAVAASARGVSVDLFDSRPAPSDLAAHVEVAPSMLRDLVALGVGDECARVGFPYRGVDVFDLRGRVLFTLPTAPLAGARYPAALGIQLSELHRVLSDAASRQGARLHWGSPVTGIRNEGRQALILFGAEQALQADLVLLAAGHGSALQTAMFPAWPAPSNLGQVWSYAMVRRPTALDRPAIFSGMGARKVLLVPVRTDLAGLALVEPLGSAKPAAPPLERLRLALRGLPGWASDLARQLHEHSRVEWRPVRSGLMPAPWHNGCVLAVGDAAHAIAPQFGQAAATAVEDALVVAELLGAADDGEALGQAFMARRLARVQQIHRITQTAALWDLAPNGETDFRQLTDALSQTVSQPP